MAKYQDTRAEILGRVAATPVGTVTATVRVTVDGEPAIVVVTLSALAILDVARRAATNKTGQARTGGLVARAQK